MGQSFIMAKLSECVKTVCIGQKPSFAAILGVPVFVLAANLTL